MGMDVYKVPLTITSRFASTRTRWTHGPKALSTRGDGAERHVRGRAAACTVAVAAAATCIVAVAAAVIEKVSQ